METTLLAYSLLKHRLSGVFEFKLNSLNVIQRILL